MKINQNQKKLTIVFLFLFFLSFVTINWNDVSWLFNYRVMSSLVSDFFNPYPDTAKAIIGFNNKVNSTVQTPPSAVAKKVYPYSARDNSLQIVSLGVEAPVIIGQSTSTSRLEGDLDRGVVYYPGSVLPGENGQIAILGHSAPPNWPKIKYDWVFTNIESLQAGDQIILNFNHHQYTYKVLRIEILKPGQELGTFGLTNDNNILTLVSCWPPGKNYQRITATAELL